IRPGPQFTEGEALGRLEVQGRTEIAGLGLGVPEEEPGLRLGISTVGPGEVVRSEREPSLAGLLPATRVHVVAHRRTLGRLVVEPAEPPLLGTGEVQSTSLVVR